MRVIPKIYSGNADQNTPVSNDLPSPGRYLEARYIRVLPHEFQGNICMRFEFYECVGKLMVLLFSNKNSSQVDLKKGSSTSDQMHFNGSIRKDVSVKDLSSVQQLEPTLLA